MTDRAIAGLVAGLMAPTGACAILGVAWHFAARVLVARNAAVKSPAPAQPHPHMGSMRPAP